MEIVIKGKTYKVKYSVRAMLAFEQMTDKPFEISNLTDLYIFYYSMLLAGMNDEPLTFEEFLDASDEDPELIKQFSDYMERQGKVNAQLKKEDESKKKR